MISDQIGQTEAKSPALKKAQFDNFMPDFNAKREKSQTVIISGPRNLNLLNSNIGVKGIIRENSRIRAGSNAITSKP